MGSWILGIIIKLKKMKDNKNVLVKGEITAKFYDQTKLKPWQRRINAIIAFLRKVIPEIMRFYQLGELIRVDKRTNVICNAGFNTITKRLTGDATYTCEINKMALGTGSGTPAASDTQLFNEVYRNDTASGTDSGNVAYLTAYYTEAEVTGTFTEFGNFIDGTAAANSGQLWSHIAGLNWVKDNTTVLVVSCKYTFVSV